MLKFHKHTTKIYILEKKYVIRYDSKHFHFKHRAVEYNKISCILRILY